MGVWKKLFVCSNGASAIEFAIVLPTLAVIIVGMADMALKGNLKYVMTKSANRSLELALAKGPVDDNFDYIAREAATAAEVSVNDVAVDYWLECEYVRQPSFSGSCTSPDLPFRYLKVTITSEYKSLFPDWVLPASSPVTGTATLRIQ